MFVTSIAFNVSNSNVNFFICLLSTNLYASPSFGTNVAQMAFPTIETLIPYVATT